MAVYQWAPFPLARTRYSTTRSEGMAMRVCQWPVISTGCTRFEFVLLGCGCGARYEYFAGGRLITVFSARDYCNRIHNSGAMLEISRELSVLPKLIHTKFDDTKPMWMDNRDCSPPRNARSAIARRRGTTSTHRAAYERVYVGR